MGVCNAARIGVVAVAAAIGTRVCMAQAQPAPEKPAAAGAPAGAPQEQAAPAASQPPAGGSGKWSIELHGGGVIDFESDIQDTAGSVEVYRAGFGVSIGTPPGFTSERSRLTLDIDEEVSWYLFHGAAGLAPGTTDPFENVYQTTIRPTFKMQQDQHWSWFVGGILDFSGEASADVGDSATYGAFGGAKYAFDDHFTLTFGLGAKTRLEDSALAIPVVGLDWRVNDQVTVSAGYANGVRVTAKMSETVTVSLGGNYELREYRLRDDGPIPSGVARDSRIPIGLEIAWSPSPKMTVTLSGGAVVWQQFRIDDSDGNRISETNTDPAPFVGIKVSVAF